MNLIGNTRSVSNDCLKIKLDLKDIDFLIM